MNGLGDPLFILRLPDGYKLIYKRIPDYGNEEYVKIFSDEELGNIDMETLDYINIVKWFADIWEAVSQQASEADPDQSATPELEQQPPAQPPSESEEQRPTTYSWGLDNPTPEPPRDENGLIVPHI